MATGIFDFDLRNMSMLFVGDTFYVLIYTIENVCHIGPRGVDHWAKFINSLEIEIRS